MSLFEKIELFAKMAANQLVGQDTIIEAEKTNNFNNQVHKKTIETRIQILNNLTKK